MWGGQSELARRVVAVVEARVLRRVRHAPHTESVHQREASPRLAQTEASKERIVWGLDRLVTPERGVMRWSWRTRPAGEREESAVEAQAVEALSGGMLDSRGYNSTLVGWDNSRSRHSFIHIEREYGFCRGFQMRNVHLVYLLSRYGSQRRHTLRGKPRVLHLT